MSLPLTGKVAIVTGSSRSIGAGIAQRLAQDGANVIINYVSNVTEAEKVVAEIEKDGRGTGFPVKADISSTEGRKHLIETTVQKYGKIDILVNNAGIMGMSTFPHVDEAFFDAHFALNTKAPFFLTQLAVPHMPQGGRVIFFSSSLTAASVVTPPYVTYVGSKGAIEQISRALCKELAPKLITVNTVSPGPVDTPLFRQGKTEAMLDALRNFNPHKRFASVDDIKGAVNFLCGPEAAWITGQNLRVNGGFAV